MSQRFLSIQATYAHACVALFSEHTCLGALTNSHTSASSHLIPLAMQLLAAHNLTLDDISFIAVDQGPGAFTSLRVALATVNGISFARRIPLVGVNSLDALLFQISQENGLDSSTLRVAILNAYNNDVYYAYAQNHVLTIPSQGCCKIDQLLEFLVACSAEHIIMTGNAVALHRQCIDQTLKNKKIAIVHCDVPAVQTIATLGLQAWKEQKEHVFWLEPNYLKTQLFAVRSQS